MGARNCRRIVWAALGLIVFGWLFLPGFFVPRYSLALLACLASLAAIAATGEPGARTVGLTRGIFFIGLLGLPFTIVTAGAGLRWIRSNNAGAWVSPQRTSVIAERYPLGFPEIYPSPAMIRAIRESCGAGTTLCWNVSGFEALLWNRDYSNRVVFLPCVPEDRYPHGAHQRVAPSPTQLTDWLAELARQKATHVLVYEGTAYTKALDAPAAGFARVFADPAEPGHVPMVLYRKKEVTGK